MANADGITKTDETQAKRKHRPTKRCQFDGCDQWAWARGFCGSHYQKMRNAGKLPVVRHNVGDLNARFDASYQVNPETGCWEWTAWIHPKGYGILSVGGRSKKVRAHRFSYVRFVGSIPEGMLVCHKCDVRKCCNPTHLFLGTHTENARDCVSKGRKPASDGKRRFTDAQAMNIRIMFARGSYSMQNLADIYRVDQKTISEIVLGRSYL